MGHTIETQYLSLIPDRRPQGLHRELLPHLQGQMRLRSYQVVVTSVRRFSVKKVSPWRRKVGCFRCTNCLLRQMTRTRTSQFRKVNNRINSTLMNGEKHEQRCLSTHGIRFNVVTVVLSLYLKLLSRNGKRSRAPSVLQCLECVRCWKQPSCTELGSLYMRALYCELNLCSSYRKQILIHWTRNVYYLDGSHPQYSLSVHDSSNVVFSCSTRNMISSLSGVLDQPTWAFNRTTTTPGSERQRHPVSRSL